MIEAIKNCDIASLEDSRLRIDEVALFSRPSKRIRITLCNPCTHLLLIKVDKNMYSV